MRALWLYSMRASGTGPIAQLAIERKAGRPGRPSRAPVPTSNLFHVHGRAKMLSPSMDGGQTLDSLESSPFRSVQRLASLNLGEGDPAGRDECEPKPLLHVEVCLKPSSTLRYDAVRDHVEKHLRIHHRSLISNSPLSLDLHDTVFREVEFARTCESTGQRSEVHQLDSVELKVHVYQLNDDPVAEEINEEEQIQTNSHLLLPSRELEGLWDNLIFDDRLQLQLLDFVYTTLLFSDRLVDPNIVSFNRVILLHGPPGSGKTSLCKALAQKLSVRLSSRYAYGKLVEINSHSLFSKWFSESGKLVQKLFQSITELLDDEESFVCVLIDEVESLAAARKASGSEPSDAIRVVNALLTQIDAIKRRKNVLIMCTSNITEAIDLAFVDRADIKMHIGNPSTAAAYAILASAIQELIRTRIIGATTASQQESLYAPPNKRDSGLLEYRELEVFRHMLGSDHPSARLFAIAQKCEGMSGRSLRKLPFLAHAFYVQSERSSLDTYLKALDLAVCNEHRARGLMGAS
ncbi:pachytene checkpoint protein 2 [Hyaloraphidium curvatum]|nr:pachytene checkpoint protein 2 [Hyaloraphidium curvatum]